MQGCARRVHKTELLGAIQYETPSQPDGGPVFRPGEARFGRSFMEQPARVAKPPDQADCLFALGEQKVRQTRSKAIAVAIACVPDSRLRQRRDQFQINRTDESGNSIAADGSEDIITAHALVQRIACRCHPPFVDIYPKLRAGGLENIKQPVIDIVRIFFGPVRYWCGRGGILPDTCEPGFNWCGQTDGIFVLRCSQVNQCCGDMFAIMAHRARAGTEDGIAMQGDVLIVGLAAPVRDAAYNSAASFGLDLHDQPAINIILGALQCR
ncbi:hypothetical protein BES08_30255 (plasmid) [Novosphingobium resinovorum]|uniref:Uncharacterized protein n=1 Tax=Novosphingobium resinovorum TaxID=158500 RepID=A0A1D8AGC1_9SPHN|nr:hypothetical protein BES08_30255 [Novosphingobium resinovorum]